MTHCEHGDIVLVQFPFTNIQFSKKRPAVVISSATYQEHRPDLILMAVTSQIRQPLAFGEYQLQDWRSAGLLKPSVLKPLIATIEQQRILKTLGKMTDKDLSGLKSVLERILAAS